MYSASFSVIWATVAATFEPDDRWQSTEVRKQMAEIGGGRKVNSDGENLAENNKAVANPPAVT
ncbi:hypothetical protein T09_12937 [Trichinella sp. T9]|nr:hypothetical protein T09_12937 [Trichinella sp. T9]